MPTARFQALACVADGKIYVIGGKVRPSNLSPPNTTNTVEEYNPATDTWTTKSSTLTEHDSRGVAAVVDGKIYVIGGGSDPQVVEQYNPATDTWTTKSRKPTWRVHTTAVVIDGKINVFSGVSYSGTSITTIERYDPATDTWSTQSYLWPSERVGLITAVVNEDLYIFNANNKSVQLYDPATANWTMKGPMQTARWGTASGVVEGKVYIVGGTPKQVSPPDPLNSPSLETVEQYDTVTGNWTTRTPMPKARSYSAAGVVNGKLYVIGGYNEMSGALLTLVEEYDPANDTVDRHIWTEKAPMPTGRCGMASAVLNGQIYVIGGENGISILPTMEKYDPVTDTWTTKVPMPTGRTFLVAAAANGKVYAIGGASGTSGLQTVEEYDPATDTWTTKSPMPTGRYAMQATVVDGKIYVIGGTTNIVPLEFHMVEEYDPATDTWTTKSPMPTGRHSFATAVVDGKIYAIGGSGDNNVEQYDPMMDTWAAKASLLDYRSQLAAASVNGRIYAIGGWGGSYWYLGVDAVQEYDPVTDIWRTKTTMPTKRTNFVAEAVNDRIYAIGGNRYAGGYLNNVEEYDPAQEP